MDSPPFGNIADGPPPAPEAGEWFETLARLAGAQVERIHSPATDTPGEWYDQPHDEWVVVVDGRAEVRLDGEDGRRIPLRAGDWLFLKAHLRHRVERVAAPTLWLAVHGTPPAPIRS